MVPFQVPGVCIVMTKNKKTVIDESFGFANVMQNQAASTRNYHRIASISKTFTRAAIMRLVEKRLLSLESKVFSEVLEGLFDYSVCPGSELITVDHLLNHMCGVWPTTTRAEDPVFNRNHLTYQQLIQQVLLETTFTKESPPGSSYVYSNFGYLLLGRIIEQVTGHTYLGFLKDQFQINVQVGGSSQNQLRSNESYYYSRD
jgi:CubicO group peptidase (beta-lactamase class C family)